MSFMLSTTKHLQVFVFFVEACFKEQFIWMWRHNTFHNLDSWWIVWSLTKYSSVLFQRSESVSGSSLANLISRIKINRGFISLYDFISCRILECSKVVALVPCTVDGCLFWRERSSSWQMHDCIKQLFWMWVI